MSEPWVEQDALDTYFESAPNTAPDQFSIPEFDTWFHTVTANSINPLDTINTQEPAADDHDHDTSIVDPGHAAATQLQLQEPVTIVTAYCINFQGEVFPIISQHQPSFETSGYSNLHFLGFFMQKIHDVAKPLLTDHFPFYQSSIDSAALKLLGLVKKKTFTWSIPVYCNYCDIENMRQILNISCISPVYMNCDANLTSAAYVYVLSDDDSYFRPWELGKSQISVFPQVQLDPRSAVVPPIAAAVPPIGASAAVPRVENPQPEPQVGMLLTFVDSSAPKRGRGQSFEEAPRPKKSKGTEPDKVSLATLKRDFPQLVPATIWAKARYRALCIFKPYIIGQDRKLQIAEKAYDFGLIKYPIDPSVVCPGRDAMVALISAEHSTFRTNSIDRANRAIEAKFPLTLTTKEIVETLNQVCSLRYIHNFVLKSNAPSSSSSGSESSKIVTVDQNIDCPFPSDMILSLLTDIISQRVRSCKIILRELLIQDIPHGKPIPVVLGAYGLSLLFDALVNRFKEKLALLPAEETTNILPRNILRRPTDMTCDGFKFYDFQKMWAECEASEEYCAGLLEIRMRWREIIFAEVTTSTDLDSEST